MEVFSDWQKYTMKYLKTAIHCEMIVSKSIVYEKRCLQFDTATSVGRSIKSTVSKRKTVIFNRKNDNMENYVKR